MQEVEKTENGLRGEDRFGSVYELGIPARYLQECPSLEDYNARLYWENQLNSIIANPTGDNGLILPVVRDEHGQPYFYFNVHHKSKPKYKYRETVKVGDAEHIFEADTIERLNELKLNLEK